MSFSDMLAEGEALIDEQTKANISRTVRMGLSSDWVEVQATVGATNFRLQNQNGVQIRVDTRDYLADPADLMLYGERFEPEWVEEDDAAAGLTRRFEVVSIETEPAVRDIGPSFTQLRIHTQQTSENAT